MMTIPAAALAAMLLLLPLILLARRIGLVDAPGGRKRHVGNVPLVGGLAIYLSLVAIGASAGVIVSAPALLFAGLAGLAVAAGLIDDLWRLPAWAKLAWQFAIAMSAVICGGPALGEAGALFEPQLGLHGIGLGAVGPLASVFAYVAIMNATNLLDGADGLAGGVGTVVLGAVLLLSQQGGLADAGLCALELGAVAGFLCFNLPLPWRRRPIVFLGDAGSMLIGFSLAWFSLDLHRSAPQFPAAAFLWLLALPVLDMARVACGRMLRGESPFTAGRDHLHHLLLDRGLPAGTVALVMIGASAALAGVAVIAAERGASNAALLGALMLLCFAYAGSVVKLRGGAADLRHAPEPAGAAREGETAARPQPSRRLSRAA